MIFNGINNQKIEFKLLLFDRDEWELMTGSTTITEPYDIGLRLDMVKIEVLTSIFISDVNKMIQWFDGLHVKKSVEYKLFVLHNQLTFELLQNNADFKTIRIEYDGTLPVPGIGGCSEYIDDSLQKDCIECKLDNENLNRIIIELKNELYQSLESYK
ncbi:hypothetical protein LNP04_06900 [Chryseobacterium sp. C-71]|uniref:hypothetical protein n=1 Tax=Chryseobacterium sp. C-71 TaxID=2893882 RepID=UPI001E40B92C|nr:hypothetical protein [Chryseobacterium sp. C-71]UFH33429.1 hypothetical protein LNP04_06900 [Chryseobacterium sp. C-71]